jgi:tyrosyl-tRNA synthetase
MPRYFALTTGWHPDQVAEVAGGLADGTLAPVEAKRLLGRTVVDLYHGDGTGATAEAEFDRVFKAHAEPRDIAEHVLDPAEARDGLIPVANVLRQAGLSASNKEARRLIAQGGVRRDGVVLADPEATVAPAELDGATLSVGRRRWVRIRSA